jgi:hypothetical protein
MNKTRGDLVIDVVESRAAAIAASRAAAVSVDAYGDAKEALRAYDKKEELLAAVEEEWKRTVMEKLKREGEALAAKEWNSFSGVLPQMCHTRGF